MPSPDLSPPALSRCAVRWGACPDHGNTLVDDDDGGSRCTVCGRRWATDRRGAPCDEPGDMAIVVDGGDSPTGRICRGHAIAAQEQRPEWVRFEPVALIERHGVAPGA